MPAETSAAMAQYSMPVYPFIPPPTLEMELRQDHHHHWAAAAAATEPHDAAGAENAEEEPSTPTSTTVTTRSVGTTPRTSADGPTDEIAADRGRWTTQGGDGDGHGESKEEHEEARCSLSYVRGVQSGGEGGPYRLLHGQVWRGSGDGKGPWRRHQWVVGG